jgi:hypothetical protein
MNTGVPEYAWVSYAALNRGMSEGTMTNPWRSSAVRTEGSWSSSWTSYRTATSVRECGVVGPW